MRWTGISLPSMFFMYFIYALALAISTIVVVRPCAVKHPIRLTRGLAVALLIALVQGLAMVGGMALGNFLRFPSEGASAELYLQVNQLIFLGLIVVVAVKIFIDAFRKEETRLPYDISRWMTVFALSIALAINTLLIGIGLGFSVEMKEEWLLASLPLLIMQFLGAYLAIMMGRRKKKMNDRRWMLVVVLLLLVVTIFNVVG